MLKDTIVENKTIEMDINADDIIKAMKYLLCDYMFYEEEPYLETYDCGGNSIEITLEGRRFELNEVFHDKFKEDLLKQLTKKESNNE